MSEVQHDLRKAEGLQFGRLQFGVLSRRNQFLYIMQGTGENPAYGSSLQCFATELTGARSLLERLKF